MSVNRQFPVREAMVKTGEWTVSDRWHIYFRDLQQTVDQSPSLVVNPVEALNENASIGTTPIPTDSLSAGLYLVQWFIEIITAAVTTSSVILTVAFTSASVAKTWVSATVNGNTTSTVDSGSKMMYVDAGTPVSYSTTYASNGAGQMHYNLYVVLQRVAV